jgi:hypothetical protein
LQCGNDFATNVRGGIFLSGGKRLIVAGQGQWRKKCRKILPQISLMLAQIFAE